jgi:hypothetical protein
VHVLAARQHLGWDSTPDDGDDDNLLETEADTGREQKSQSEQWQQLPLPRPNFQLPGTLRPHADLCMCAAGQHADSSCARFCSCGRTWSSATVVPDSAHPDPLLVYDMHRKLPLSIEAVQCACGLRREYDRALDAQLDGLFFHKETCVSYAVLIELDLHIEHGGLAQDAFHRARQDAYTLSGDKDGFISKTKFVELYRHWIRACSVDSDALFSCPTCSRRQPSQCRWTWDACSLGIQNSQLKVTPLPTCAEAKQRNTKEG